MASLSRNRGLAMSTVSLAIAGAAGRMGKRLIALASEQPDIFRITTTIDSPSSSALGQDAGTHAGIAPLKVAITASLAGNPNVIIDFTAPAATPRPHSPMCRAQNRPPHRHHRPHARGPTAHRPRRPNHSHSPGDKHQPRRQRPPRHRRPGRAPTRRRLRHRNRRSPSQSKERCPLRHGALSGRIHLQIHWPLP